MVYSSWGRPESQQNAREDCEVDAGTYRSGRERSFDEGYDERSQTAIDVEPDVVFLCELREGGDVVHVPVGEIWSRTDELGKPPRSISIHFLKVDRTLTIIVFGFLSKKTKGWGGTNSKKQNPTKTHERKEHTHIALFTFARFTFRVIGSTGIQCSLIFKYAAPLSNAA